MVLDRVMIVSPAILTTLVKRLEFDSWSLGGLKAAGGCRPLCMSTRVAATRDGSDFVGENAYYPQSLV